MPRLKPGRKTVVVISALFLGAFLFFLFSTDDVGKEGENAPPIPEQAIEKFNVTETEAGKTKWVLDAKSAQIVESQKKVYLDAPVIKFYEGGEYVSTLVSEKGRIDSNNYDIWGDGKCLLTTVKGERLDTHNLHYKSEIKRIVTEEKVKLERKDETIYGQGMEATPDLETIMIKKQRVVMHEKKK
ncbi:MAG: LPS export ABC transporter periplasmic protein LptC [Endomicrobiales bacterium]|nr:LPS export ABC transporter periplasmic protein LptC [Endomicrobiales bacterium]